MGRHQGQTAGRAGPGKPPAPVWSEVQDHSDRQHHAQGLHPGGFLGRVGSVLAACLTPYKPISNRRITVEQPSRASPNEIQSR
jgi:hypothetical protein